MFELIQFLPNNFTCIFVLCHQLIFAFKLSILNILQNEQQSKIYLRPHQSSLTKLCSPSSSLLFSTRSTKHWKQKYQLRKKQSTSHKLISRSSTSHLIYRILQVS